MRQAALPLALVALIGCQMPELPGEEVGSYAISGELMENSCGREALPAADPLEFQAQLRRENGVGYWVVQPPATAGRLDEDGAFSFRRDSVTDLEEPAQARVEQPEDYFVNPDEADRPSDEPLCRLRIEEEIRGRVLRVSAMDALLGDADAGGAEYDLEGENTIEIRAMSGSDCGRVVASGGGPFAQLPCQVRYEITGTLVEE